ncbi:RNA 2',3'-cyclic phosphodiesterase [uncultured Sphingomonas sp.]|uniref:RNA 2',3'-cyclic phosphodiesterase n=1 Tax=uncultured Sphingomonas sp. TaxID=158754 RepID=UPI0025D4874F|nr:RNA 2',3'-cyclic phosphodiesterase [uncultured Sphingomonas sp.]
MHRLFVALRPPADVRAMLLDAMGGIAGARWQDDEQLHLTLRYIGEVERPMAEDVAIALESVRAAAVTLAISGVGKFDGGGRPGGAAWAGVTPREPLAALHKKLDSALVRAGLQPERRAYLPHITLARLSRSAGSPDRFLADHAMLSSAPFTLDQVLLYESHLGSSGATYEAVARYPLARQLRSNTPQAMRPPELPDGSVL